MAESDTPVSRTAMRKRACDFPDPRLIGAATRASPSPLSGGRTQHPTFLRGRSSGSRHAPHAPSERNTNANSPPSMEYPSTNQTAKRQTTCNNLPCVAVRPHDNERQKCIVASRSFGLNFNPGKFDYFVPLGNFFTDEPFEFVRRAGQRRAAELGHPCLSPRIINSGIKLLVEL
jgi:hypothetical protein